MKRIAARVWLLLLSVCTAAACAGGDAKSDLEQRPPERLLFESEADSTRIRMICAESTAKCHDAVEELERAPRSANQTATELMLWGWNCGSSYFPSCARAAALSRRVGADELHGAMRTLENACGAADNEACLGAAGLYFRAVGVPADRPRAISLLERACSADAPTACARLATYLSLSPSDQKTDRRIIEMWTLSCEADVFAACSQLGVSAQLGTHGVPKDAARARTFYNRACDHNDPEGCYSLALMLASGSPSDRVRSSQLLRSACAATHGSACFELAKRHNTGEGEARDGVEAERLWVRSCEMGGSSAGCSAAGSTFLDRGDGVRALSYFAVGCAGESALACRNAAFVTLGNAGFRRDETLARQYLTKACDLADADSCAELATLK